MVAEPYVNDPLRQARVDRERFKEMPQTVNNKARLAAGRKAQLGQESLKLIVDSLRTTFTKVSSRNALGGRESVEEYELWLERIDAIKPWGISTAPVAPAGLLLQVAYGIE